MMFSTILKLLNACLIVLFFFNQMKEEKDKDKNEAEEEKDTETWYTISDGTSRYKGEWKNGVPHGKGIKEIFEGKYTDANGHPCDSDGVPCCGSIIEGNFVNGCTTGYFKQLYKQEGEETQPYYEGEFYEGEHNGQGAYYYGDGSYYKGNFTPFNISNADFI